MRLNISTLIVATFLLLSVGCRSSKKRVTMPPLEVDVAIATIDSLCDQITFSTTIEPLYEAIIEPRINGYLQSIRYSDGMPVKRGATIFTINPIEYQTAMASSKAQLAQAEASLALAESNYQRAIPLAAIDAISQMDLEQYKSSYQAALSSVEYAHQEVESSRLNLGYTTITAPISGIIAATKAKEGDYVGVGSSFTTLTTIKYIDTVILSLPIAQSRYLNYTDGDSFDNATLLSNIEVTLPNNSRYGYPAQYYYTKQSSGDNTSTLTIMVRCPNPERLLKSGMFARVNSNIGEQKAKLVIPQKAVNQSQGVSYVWVVKSDSTVTQSPIKVGSTHGDMWSVESGIKQGDMVLLTGALKVKSGSRVNPKVIQ